METTKFWHYILKIGTQSANYAKEQVQKPFFTQIPAKIAIYNGFPNQKHLLGSLQSLGSGQMIRSQATDRVWQPVRCGRTVAMSTHSRVSQNFVASFVSWACSIVF